MNFEELLKDKIFNLPIDQPKSKPFNKIIKEYLLTFLDKVNQLPNKALEFNGLSISGSYIKKTQEAVIFGLIDTIEQYYFGSPHQAYKCFDQTLRNKIKDVFVVINQINYSAWANFYKIREKKDNYPFSPKEMFHIPFELRGNVRTQRYSIPGFPSLYLGRSLYICWEELGRPQVNHIQACRLVNTKSLKLLDLTPPSTMNPTSYDVYKYFMTIPIIACCSVKVRDYTHTFKPEYIIPQLLLEWVGNNEQIDGIQYNSSHVSKKVFKQKGGYSNIVLPVRTSEDSGLCGDLQSTFKMTETISAQLHQFAMGAGNFFYSRSSELDTRVPELELISGRKLPYSHSTLGELERYLNGMDTNTLK